MEIHYEYVNSHCRKYSELNNFSLDVHLECPMLVFYNPGTKFIFGITNDVSLQGQ